MTRGPLFYVILSEGSWAESPFASPSQGPTRRRGEWGRPSFAEPEPRSVIFIRCPVIIYYDGAYMSLMRCQLACSFTSVTGGCPSGTVTVHTPALPETQELANIKKQARKVKVV